MTNEMNETVLYIGSEGAVTGQFIIDQKNETLWATQKVIANIFGTTGQNISKHFKNIFQEEELIENEVCISNNNLFTTSNGFINESLINSKKGGRPEKWYNLDGIIAVGYRVNSKEATNFRKWSTNILKEYMIKGFALDDELLKKGKRFDKDYFNELSERYREIRTSERRFNQKITDIYATSYDYNKDAEITKEFFATVQNKLIYAVSGHTAAEIIAERANSNKTNMGLTTWKDPNGKILMSDTVISKNYLNMKELDNLNRIVEAFLNLAEFRANNQTTTSMEEWKEFLITFIKLNQLPILTDKGKISHEKAVEIAKNHYNKFKVYQDKNFESDFDSLINEIKMIENKKKK